MVLLNARRYYAKIQWSLYSTLSAASLQDQRMPVHTGHEPKANCPPYGLCNFALVDGSEAGLARVLYPAHLGHVFGHHGEVLRAVSACVSLRVALPRKRTLYSLMGLMPRVSKASLPAVLRAFFHFFCSGPERSLGA
jgi:hypothetical protein